MNTTCDINNTFHYNLSNIEGFDRCVNYNINNESININNETEKIENKCIYFFDYNSKFNSNLNYKIIKYNKELLNENDYNTYGLIRSVIVNSQNKVVGFSPPKSLSYECFVWNYSKINNSIIAQEFVDGTMINLFWDPSIGINGDWQISTKSTVEADTYFYQNSNVQIQKTFRTMFFEACNCCNLDLNSLDKKLSYSFVLQHPENRIVTPIPNICLYLIEVYEIILEDNQYRVRVKEIEDIKNSEYIKNSFIRFPETYNFTSYTDIFYNYSNTHYEIKGIVIKNLKNNERTKVRNVNYENVKMLKGNQPKLEYQYLSLRKESRVGEYLYYFPEASYNFSIFRSKLHLSTSQIFVNYCARFIKKIISFQDIPSQYKKHISILHNHYLDNLKPFQKKITFEEVINYVNSLHPSQQMCFL